MALQTPVTISSSPANNYTLNLILTENGTSITNNTSSVSWQLQLVTSYYGFTDFRVGWSVSLAGRVVSSKTWSDASYSSIAKNNGTLTIASGTSNVTHNADGSLDMACAASIFMDPSRTDAFLPPRTNATTGERSPSVSGSMALTTIPRASTLTAANGTLGTQQTLTINRASTSFTHTLTYACGSLTGQTSGLGSITGSGTTQTCPFTPPVSLAAQNTTGQSVSVTFTLTTKNGSTTVGTSTKTVSMDIPDSVKPTASATVAVVNDNTTVSGWGVAVKGYSKYRVTTTFTGARGSTLKSRSVKVSATGQTLTASPATSALLASTDRTVKVTVTDSRDRQSDEVSVTGPVIYDYGNPSISEAKAYRCTDGGVKSDSGTYLYVKCTGDVSPCGNHNEKTVQYRRRVTGGSWTDWTALTSGTAQTVNAGLDTTKSYEVQFRVTDSLGGARSVTVTIPTAAVVLNLRAGGKGAAFGGYAQLDEVVDFTTWDVVGRVKGLGYCPPIPSGADLDGYVTPGEYAVTGDDLAASITNLPVAKGGRLTVYSSMGGAARPSATWKYITQEYTTVTGETYRRIGSSGSGTTVTWPNSGQWDLVYAGHPVYTTGTVTYTTTYATSHDIEVRKYPLLGMCYVEGTCIISEAVSANTAVKIATLPSGFRPVRTVALAPAMSGGVGVIHAETGGSIYFRRTTAITAGQNVSVRFGGWYLT